MDEVKLKNVCEGPYRQDPLYPGDIQTHDGSREVARVQPDFEHTTGLKAGEDMDTAKLISKSWCMWQLLKRVQAEGSILSDTTVEDITTLLKGLE